MKHALSLYLSIIICLVFLKVSAQQDTFYMFYLGGQSNMDGYGYIQQLPEDLKSGYENIWIFHGNSAGDNDLNGGLGQWGPLQPGHGVGFKSDGKKNSYSNRFGLELSFGKTLQSKYPNKKFAFIKYSKGGSSIDSLAAGNFGSWEADYQSLKGLNQYDHFLTTLTNATRIRDINKDGIDDLLLPAGILWMQGESDGAHGEQIAMNYYKNLKRLMDLTRSALRKDDLPIVIGKISDSWNDKDGKVWDYGELVQYAQEKFVREDSNAAIVRSTRYYKYSDTWHYDSAGYIDMGKRFAEEMIKLMGW